MINAAAVAACPGIVPTVIDDPTRCGFDPAFACNRRGEAAELWESAPDGFLERYSFAARVALPTAPPA